MDKYSNCVIIGGDRVELPDEFVDAGLTASNYIDDDEPRFKHKLRTKKLGHFVLHETCGNSAKGCKRTLLRKGYGVQLILSEDGHLSCHGDLWLDVMAHANQLNKTSIGIEVVNPYSPVYDVGRVKRDTIPADWWTWVPAKKHVRRLLEKKGWHKVPRKYCLPTEAQMEAIRLIVPWLCLELDIPYEFPTEYLSRKQRKIKGWNVKPKARPGAGVVEHRSFSNHSDGRYILERLIEERA